MGKKNKEIKTKEIKTKEIKTKEIKTELIKDVDDNTNQIKKFIIILAGVAIVSVLLYFVSTKFLVGDGVEKPEEEKEVTISDTVIDGGHVFNRPYDEYYVFAYDREGLEEPIYTSLIDNAGDDKGKIYYLDLGTKLNKQYVKEETNPKATKPSELAMKTPTLIKIKNGKIVKYLEDLESIEKELK